MSHESVWNSRPRGYGKGARSWYEYPDPIRNEKSMSLFGPTRTNMNIGLEGGILKKRELELTYNSSL